MGKKTRDFFRRTFKGFADEEKIIRNTLKNFSVNYKSVIFFEFLYKLLAIFLIIPINYFILNKFMGDIGVNSITNTDLIKLGLSFEGIIYILLILGVSYVAVFIEMGILTYMANKSHKGEKVSLIEGAINSFKIIPRTISFYMFPLIFMAGFIGPLTGFGLYNSLIEHLTIPSFITGELFKTTGGTIFYYLVYASLLVILFRWMIAIPAVVIEKISLKKAFKKSTQCYKSDRVKLVAYLAVWVILNIVLKVLVIDIYTNIGNIIIEALGLTTATAGIFMIFYLILFFVGYVIISTMTLPLFISFLVELYYSYNNEGVEYRNYDSIEKYESNKIYQLIIRHKKSFTTIVIAAFFLVVTITGAGAGLSSAIPRKVEVTAHRGSSISAPENSKSAVELAILEGADYAEIDVMLTKDKHVVLFHDNNLKRIDGTERRIKDMTLKEVRGVDNGSYFSKEYKGEKIPTLKEILELAKGSIKLNIELKTVSSNDQLPEEVAKVIKEAKMDKQVVVSSLDYDALKVFKTCLPVVDVGYIVTFGFGDLTKLDVDFLSMEYGMVSKKRIYDLHSIGKKVHVWTLNTVGEVEKAIEMGVDNIITDNPSMVKGIVEFPIEYIYSDYMAIFNQTIRTIMEYI
ncbi:MAG: glycerophosphoryl diester phosphodiesterase membrane domain-containing protein [Clostridium sp.]